MALILCYMQHEIKYKKLLHLSCIGKIVLQKPLKKHTMFWVYYSL